MLGLVLWKELKALHWFGFLWAGAWSFSLAVTQNLSELRNSREPSSTLDPCKLCDQPWKKTRIGSTLPAVMGNTEFFYNSPEG